MNGGIRNGYSYQDTCCFHYLYSCYQTHMLPGYIWVYPRREKGYIFKVYRNDGFHYNRDSSTKIYTHWPKNSFWRIQSTLPLAFRVAVLLLTIEQMLKSLRFELAMKPETWRTHLELTRTLFKGFNTLYSP